MKPRSMPTRTTAGREPLPERPGSMPAAEPPGPMPAREPQHSPGADGAGAPHTRRSEAPGLPENTDYATARHALPADVLDDGGAAAIFEENVAGPQRRRRVFAALALVAAAALAVATLRGDAPEMRYVTQPVVRGDLTATVTATGTLQPTNQVDIGSELSGIIRTVEVDYNDQVTVGQVLARLDTTRLEAQVLQSKAALEAAEARVIEAGATRDEAAAQLARLERVRKLSGGKVPSQQELAAAQAEATRAKATTASAAASVLQARATLEAQQTDLSKADIVSPIDGIVLVRAVEPGQTVAASLQAPVLFTLAEDLTRMELQVSVDEADVGKVRERQPARFTVDAWPDRSFEARVEQVRYGAETLEGVVTYGTMLIVDNSEGLLRPGMTATAEITVHEIEDGVLVPNAALRFSPPQPAEEEEDSGGLLRAFVPRPRFGRRDRDRSDQGRTQRVWVLRDGVPAEVEIATGVSDGTFTEVTNGALEPGTEVIVDAQQEAT